MPAGNPEGRCGASQRDGHHRIDALVSARGGRRDRCKITEMIARQPGRLLAASASNAISLADPVTLDRLAASHGLWTRFLDWEEELAQEPGALDGGTHILFAIERT
jgi:hypothetical protein